MGDIGYTSGTARMPKAKGYTRGQDGWWKKGKREMSRVQGARDEVVIN